MFKKPTNYDGVKEASAMPTLPRGNYICKIRDAEHKIAPSGSELIELEFDICEGEYKGYYADKYKHEAENPTGGSLHWKGNIALWLPGEDEKSIKNFKRNIGYFEDANKGYHFDWNGDCSQFEDLIIGIKFQPNDYEIDGKTGEWQKPKFFESVKRIREGKSKLLEKPTQFNATIEEPVKYEPKTDSIEELPDDELPF